MRPGLCWIQDHSILKIQDMPVYLTISVVRIEYRITLQERKVSSGHQIYASSHLQKQGLWTLHSKNVWSGGGNSLGSEKHRQKSCQEVGLEVCPRGALTHSSEAAIPTDARERSRRGESKGSSTFWLPWAWEMHFLTKRVTHTMTGFFLRVPLTHT